MKCIVYKYSVDGQSVGSIQSKIGIVLHDNCKNKSPIHSTEIFYRWKAFNGAHNKWERDIYEYCCQKGCSVHVNSKAYEIENSRRHWAVVTWDTFKAKFIEYLSIIELFHFNASHDS